MIDSSQAPQYVSRTAFEEVLREIEQVPGKPHAGFFGPESMTWRISRESAIFLGAGRAALLQLAHPWVAAALRDHSNLMNDAIGRFHATFRVVYTIIFGTRAQALAAARQVYRLHTGIRGELSHDVGGHTGGQHYEANEVNALRWVFATLIESAVLAYEFALGPLPDAAREQYYQESKRMAALFGVQAAALPEDWSALVGYTAAMTESAVLGVDEEARVMAHRLLSGAGTWVRLPRWYRAMTTVWMPPRLQAGFELPLGEREQRSLQRASGILPLLYPHLPGMLRFVGPYHEAQARMHGRALGPLTRKSNYFWMGQNRLLYAQLDS